MIERDAEPIAHLHRNPYKPIELGVHPGVARRQRLPEFVSAYDCPNDFDPTPYQWDHDRQGWVLKP